MTETNDTPTPVKSFIVSVNGEGLTADVLIKYTEDMDKLWALVDLIKAQCNINDQLKPTV